MPEELGRMSLELAEGRAQPAPPLSHVHPDGAPASADPETYLDSLRRWATEKPEAVFLDFEGKLITFGELDALSTRFGNALRALGVQRGDRVATIMDNSDDAIVAFFGINKIGAIWVPVNTAYRGEFLRHQMTDSGASIAVCDACYLENLLAVADQLPDLRRVLLRDGMPPAGAAIPISPLDEHRGGDDSPIDLIISPQDIACLMYTSGTTGPSKGCILSHAYFCSTARQRNRCIVPFSGIVTWSCLPLFHTAATSTVLLANILAGERIAMAARFSVSTFWDEVEQSGATSITLLASMLSLIAHAPDTPAMLRCKGQVKVLTGVPLSAADRAIWENRFGVEYIMSFGYGQTEANMITFLPWRAPQPPADSMGPAAAEFEVMVADDRTRPVPIGQTGELIVRPTVPHAMFSGYWGRPADTLRAMGGMWWHTGDLVRLDAAGYLYFVDRKKDYLRSRGENISSFEVESAILKHADIAEVACHAIPAQPGREEELKTTAVLHASATLNERGLFEWMMETLPYFAVARYIEFRDSLPKTPTGKVQKEVLRAEGRTAATWDCEAEGLRVRRPPPAAAKG